MAVVRLVTVNVFFFTTLTPSCLRLTSAAKSRPTKTGEEPPAEKWRPLAASRQVELTQHFKIPKI